MKSGLWIDTCISISIVEVYSQQLLLTWAVFEDGVAQYSEELL